MANTVNTIKTKNGEYQIEDTTKAPIYHTSSSTTYGIGTVSNYGHMKGLNLNYNYNKFVYDEVPVVNLYDIYQGVAITPRGLQNNFAIRNRGYTYSDGSDGITQGSTVRNSFFPSVQQAATNGSSYYLAYGEGSTSSYPFDLGLCQKSTFVAPSGSTVYGDSGNNGIAEWHQLSCGVNVIESPSIGITRISANIFIPASTYAKNSDYPLLINIPRPCIGGIRQVILGFNDDGDTFPVRLYSTLDYDFSHHNAQEHYQHGNLNMEFLTGVTSATSLRLYFDITYNSLQFYNYEEE